MEEFWYGNIEPAEYDTSSGKEYKELLQLISRNEDKLLATIQIHERYNLGGSGRKCICALLVGAVRAERFCDGALMAFFRDGSIKRWLQRLAELDP